MYADMISGHTQTASLNCRKNTWFWGLEVALDFAISASNNFLKSVVCNQVKKEEFMNWNTLKFLASIKPENENA